MKRSLSLCFAAVAVASGGPALAADEPAKPSNCAFLRTIDRWTVIDERTMIIETPAGKQFKVTFTGSCPDLKHANFIEVEFGVSSGVCLSPGDRFVFRRGFFRSNIPVPEDSCVIKTIEGVPRPESVGTGARIAELKE